MQQPWTGEELGTRKLNETLLGSRQFKYYTETHKIRFCLERGKCYRNYFAMQIVDENERDYGETTVGAVRS